ncbi:MAG TPA: hypothetical protein VFE42_17760 [Chloroflexota bacterium]|nr:hypothetical protein [Chloroflexota bacterium]
MNMIHAGAVRALVAAALVVMPLAIGDGFATRVPGDLSTRAVADGAEIASAATTVGPLPGVSTTITTTGTVTPSVSGTPVAVATTPVPTYPPITASLTSGWVAPAPGFVVRGDLLHIAISVEQGAGRPLPATRVAVAAQWPGRAPLTACSMTSTLTAGAVQVFTCDWNITNAAVPNGALSLTYAVFNAQGRVVAASSTALHGMVQQPVRKIVVFLQGVCTSTDNGTEHVNSTFNGLRDFMEHQRGYRSSDFLLYSYKGGYVDAAGVWHHYAYGKRDPIAQDPATTSWTALHNALLVPYHAHHPNTTFVLVGHSLGGLIAFEELEKFVLRPGYPHGFISAIVAVDSPLHGVRPAEVLLSDALRVYPRIGSGLDCVVGGPAMKSLTARYRNKATTGQLAAEVEQAHRLGVAVATAGNTDDCVWAPNRCGAPAIGDVNTQWVKAPDAHDLVFTVAKPCLAPDLRCFIGTHGAVLSRRDGPDAVTAIADYIGRQVNTS